MKKLITIVTLGVLGLVGLHANDYQTCKPCCEQSHNYYVSATGSAGWLFGDKETKYIPEARTNITVESKTQFGGMLAVGTFVDQFRFEIEGGYRRTNITVEKYNVAYLDTFSLMGNMFYDIPVAECVDIYLGAGAGVSWIGMTETVSGADLKTERETAFTTQGMAGLAFHVAENVDLTVGYRLVLYPSKKYRDFSSNNVEVGIRFKF